VVAKKVENRTSNKKFAVVDFSKDWSLKEIDRFVDCLGTIQNGLALPDDLTHTERILKIKEIRSSWHIHQCNRVYKIQGI